VGSPAPAKIIPALGVGALGNHGKHELLTIYQRLGIADRIELDASANLSVWGFAGDTLVRAALEKLAARAGVAPGWRVQIEKRLPVAAGVGGGSSDAATALRLANDTLVEPLAAADLHAIAATVGADVPFFLVDGPQLGAGDGTTLTPLELPQDYWVVLGVPRAVQKQSTAAVYAAFDARDGVTGWKERRAAVFDAVGRVRRPRDLAALPPNDLASSPFADELRELGAFRADVSGAGPAVYGLFHHEAAAKAAKRALKRVGDAWLTAPAWYG